MDAHLRILERQAESSGNAADWEKYARALKKTIINQDVKDDIRIWVAREELGTPYVDREHLTIYATEYEARGHILNAILDHIGEIIYEPEMMDESWYKEYQTFVKQVKEGKYNEAWTLYFDTHKGKLIDGGPTNDAWSYTGPDDNRLIVDVSHEYIARCGPDIPPTKHSIRIS